MFPSLTQARLLPPQTDSSGDMQCERNHQSAECSHPQVDIDVTIHTILAKQPSEDYALVEIWNHSNKSSTLRYIYPGVVEHEGAFYDLNSLLANGELAVEARQTVYRRLFPMQRAADRLNPPNLIARSGQVAVRNTPGTSREAQNFYSVRSLFT